MHPLCGVAVLVSAAGGKIAENKSRRAKHAQNLQALSPTEARPTRVSSLASPSPLLAPLTAHGLRRR